jgi:aspartate/methionine/tyrosine aminotransferase
MKFVRMPIEVESPEERGYSTIRYNLAESSVTDRPLSDFMLKLDDLVLAYADHRGLPQLRAGIAADAGVAERDVLSTPGAAGALFFIATTLLQPDDHLIVVRPNYATNLETPRAIGCAIDLIDLRFEDGFALDMDRIRRAIRPNTRLISLTTPHNPTGVCLGAGELAEAAGIAAGAGCRLLVDETYRDMAFGPKPPLAATIAPHVVSVSSMSKSYGIPGVRVGWIVNTDPVLMTGLLAAKEQIGICGSILDETVAAIAIGQRTTFLPPLIERLRKARDRVEAWIGREEGFEWVKPEGGCVCFPRITASVAIDLDKFYRVLDEDFGTAVGPGHWFEMDRRFMRVGYGWPTAEELGMGLSGLSRALAVARL